MAESQSQDDFRITPHPDCERMTSDELRTAIAEAEEKMKLGREAKDGELEAWFVCERRLLQAELARRDGSGWLLNGGEPGVEKISEAPGDLKAGSPITVRISDVRREEVTWLWNNRIPRRKLTLIEGDPGVGKSQLTLAIAAPITRGLPVFGDQGTREPENVLIMTAEDGLGDTIRPRLESMEADLSRVIALTAMIGDDLKQRAVTLSDLATIEAAITVHKPGLVIVDPIVAFTGEADTHRANEVRGLLAPLARLAERHGCAVLAVRHLTKATGGKTIYRGQGSIDFFAAVRSCLLVGKNPDDPTEKIIVHQKSNLGPETASLKFSIEQGLFEWIGETSITADQILNAPTDSEERSEIDEAIAFLRDALAAGPVSSKDVFRQAKAAGVSERTLWRAKKRLEVKAVKFGFDGSWKWSLAAEVCQETPKAATSLCIENVADFDGVGSLGETEVADWTEIKTP